MAKIRSATAAVAIAVSLAPLASHAATTPILFDELSADLVGARETVATTNVSPLDQWNIVDGAVDVFTMAD